MTVYFNKIRKRWLYNFQLSGKRHSGYCLDEKGAPVTSRSAARMAEEVQRQRVKIAPKMAATDETTFAMVVKALIPQWRGQADWTNKERYLREVIAYFGADTPIAMIDEAKAADLPMHLLNTPGKIWVGGSGRRTDDDDAEEYWKTSSKPRSPGTVNLFLPVARMIFERATMIRDPRTNKPLIDRAPKIKDLPVAKRKARPIPDAVSIDIMAIVPQHLIDAMEATLYFGFRRGEIFGASIHQVDFQMQGFWLDAADAKDNEDAFMPGSPEAMALMRRLVDQAVERKTPNLITWRRYHKDPAAQAAEPWVPIKRPKRAWKRAMDAIEKKYGRRYRWHDLRAAFITHVAMTSGSLAAQRLARHSDFATTQAYIEVADSVRREAADQAGNRPALQSRKQNLQSENFEGGAPRLKLLK